jgi:16S rRNA processing protein RimM
MENARHLAIGKVVGTHGIKGFLKVLSYADSLDPYAPGKGVVLSGKGRPPGTFIVASARPHKRIILLALRNIDTIEKAQQWVGCEVCAERSDFPPLDDGSHYWFEIIGLDVYGLDDRHLGRIEAIFPTGSNDVFVVRKEKKEILIPAIRTVVIQIDMERKMVKVDLPEGLED